MDFSDILGTNVETFAIQDREVAMFIVLADRGGIGAIPTIAIQY
jgi:hypothetical protein